MRLLVWLGVCSILCAACGEATPTDVAEAPGASAPPAAAQREARVRAPAGFPSALETEPGIGPALFMGPGAADPTIGYVSGGVAVTIAGAPEGDRIPVRIRGPIKVRAWMPLARLQGRATRRGRVRGAPVSVRPGDPIGVRGQRDESTLIVSVRPNLGASVTMDAFEGDFPSAWIAASAPTDVAPPEEAGEAGVLAAGGEVPVYDRPQGRIIARVPAHTEAIPVQIARRSGAWSAVRIGYGPYLAGYVQAPIEAGSAPAAAAPTSAAASSDGLPARIQNDAQAPLIRVRVGARVRFGGNIVGVVDRLAYARVLHTYPNGDVDVFVAANDDLALRGLIRTRDIAASAARVVEPADADDGAAESSGAEEASSAAAE